VIQGIAGAGIGLLVGLLARPLLEAYIAARTMREARRHVYTDDPADRVTLS
jgi:hypothetical protein